MTQSSVLSPGEELTRSQTVRPESKLVPFDQVVTVQIKGDPDNIARAVTNISVEGQYVATAIGYSLLAEPQVFGPVDPEPPPIIVESRSDKSLQPPQLVLSIDFDPDSKQRRGFVEIFGMPEANIEISLTFKAAAAGSAPIKKTVTLPASGKLAMEAPLFEEPLSQKSGTITVRDLTHDMSGPQIDFTVGKSKKSETSLRFGGRLPTFGRRRIEVIGPADSPVEIHTLPAMPGGSLAVTLDNLGFAGIDLPKPLAMGSTVVMTAEGSAVSTRIRLSDDILGLDLSTIPLAFLRRGFRISGRVLRRLEKGVPIPSSELETPFEPCGADDLNFLYTITDLGSGRELQNEPVHNIAGLGIADGDRPFRTFPKPIVFRPRSVIQFEVREISGGPGTLFFVLQGYKVLGVGNRLREA